MPGFSVVSKSGPMEISSKLSSAKGPAPDKTMLGLNLRGKEKESDSQMIESGYYTVIVLAGSCMPTI